MPRSALAASCGNARDHFVPDACRVERIDFLLRTPEQHRVAALQPHDDSVGARGIDQPLVDEPLRSGVPAAALADRNLFRPCREGNDLRIDQRIVEKDVRLLEQARSAKRKEVSRPRTGANEIHRAGRLQGWGEVHAALRRNKGCGRSTEAW